MMNYDDEVELQDRRERCGAQGELGPEHLLALKADAMEVTVVAEPTQLGHVVLALVETHTGRGFSVSLTPLELEVLAFGLRRVAARMQKESERR